MSSRLYEFPRALPRIRVSMGRRPMKLRGYDGRLGVLREQVTALVREERIEIPKHRAFETRPYMERLIQLGIEYGDRHKPTMAQMDFWLLDKELIHKLFKVLVPRFMDCQTAYTRIFDLPDDYSKYTDKYGHENYTLVRPAILELRGNPFPPVVPDRRVERYSLLNTLLDEARKSRQNAKLAEHKS